MPINYDELMQAKTTDVPAHYGDRETMLYALGVGFMRDPMNTDELPFTYENGLKTVPTMATVIGWGANATLARSNINYMMVVHGEQRLTLHKPLPDTADVLMDERVVGVFDKGAGKGAVILTERSIREKQSGTKLCTLGTTIFARGDGGFGGPKDGRPRTAPASHPRSRPRTRSRHAPRPGVPLCALRRSQSVAPRSQLRQDGRLPAPDPAWLVHLWHCVPFGDLHDLQI